MLCILIDVGDGVLQLCFYHLNMGAQALYFFFDVKSDLCSNYKSSENLERRACAPRSADGIRADISESSGLGGGSTGWQSMSSYSMRSI